jgi:N-acetylmuramoyl-L-alanine amidase
MFSLTQKVFQEQRTDLATKIQTQFRERVSRNDRDVKQAGFWVLFNTKMPSVLVETGFITNPDEEKYLNSREGQDYLASSIFRACRDYFNAIDSRSGISVEKNQDPAKDPVVKPDTLADADSIKFMVQIRTTAVKTEIKPRNFKGLDDIIELNSTGMFKYAAGNFEDYSSAVKYRKKLEELYPDAFVIAVRENKILPLQQALEQKEKQKKTIR